jgi:hypothetical protein
VIGSVAACDMPAAFKTVDPARLVVSGLSYSPFHLPNSLPVYTSPSDIVMYARTALFALVAAAASVAAQTSSAPAAIPSGLLPDCATGCIDTAIAASGCTLYVYINVSYSFPNEFSSERTPSVSARMRPSSSRLRRASRNAPQPTRRRLRLSRRPSAPAVSLSIPHPIS